VTIATIEGHLVKSFSLKNQCADILPSDKITELSEAFKHYKEESLNAMKRRFGENTVGTNCVCLKS
jgi:hypothetical protein